MKWYTIHSKHEKNEPGEKRHPAHFCHYRYRHHKKTSTPTQTANGACSKRRKSPPRSPPSEPARTTVAPVRQKILPGRRGHILVGLAVCPQARRRPKPSARRDRQRHIPCNDERKLSPAAVAAAAAAPVTSVSTAACARFRAPRRGGRGQRRRPWESAPPRRCCRAGSGAGATGSSLGAVAGVASRGLSQRAERHAFRPELSRSRDRARGGAVRVDGLRPRRRRCWWRCCSVMAVVVMRVWTSERLREQRLQNTGSPRERGVEKHADRWRVRAGGETTLNFNVIPSSGARQTRVKSTCSVCLLAYTQARIWS